MVQIRKPVQRSKDIIDLRPMAGAAGRALNRASRDWRLSVADDRRRNALAKRMARAMATELQREARKRRI